MKRFIVESFHGRNHMRETSQYRPYHPSPGLKIICTLGFVLSSLSLFALHLFPSKMALAVNNSFLLRCPSDSSLFHLSQHHSAHNPNSCDIINTKVIYNTKNTHRVLFSCIPIRCFDFFPNYKCNRFRAWIVVHGVPFLWIAKQKLRKGLCLEIECWLVLVVLLALLSKCWQNVEH